MRSNARRMRVFVQGRVMIARLVKSLMHVCMPQICLLCHTVTQDSLLCQACYGALPWQEQACPKCGNRFSDDEKRLKPEAVCGRCLQSPPPFDHSICLFQYKSPIDKIIISLKFREKLVYARLLGELMAQRMQHYYLQSSTVPDCLMPVPLSIDRLKERGYNQALEIARPGAKILGCVIDMSAFRHPKSGLTQASSTSLKERRANVRGVFAVHPCFSAHHVAIVDDVLTSGSTVAALARVLRKAGVSCIDVWCCARADWQGK